MRHMKWLGILGAFAAGCAESADETDVTTEQAQSPVMTVTATVHHDVSAPLRDAPVVTGLARQRVEHPIGRIPINGPDLDDPVVQSTHANTLAPTPNFPTVSTILNFAGVGNGDYGFAPNAAPPDTNGVVGATQYVQWVNESFAVFNKSTGAIAPGFPKAGNSIWAGFGGGCQTNNDGDPIVQYDKLANRWILTQFSVSTTPNLQCVAVSTTSDATGTYARYAFQYANFPDYPKLSVWPDAYYISFNMFNLTTGSFLGAQACAYDRAAMLAGGPATQICFQQSTSTASLLPSDLDGATLPPAGSPNFFVTLQTTSSLNLFKFKVNSFAPASATFTGPTTISVASFSTACTNGGACIRQSGTSQRLDSLSDRAMYRLAYRNISGHETLLLAHSVNASNRRGIRWYELRSPLTGTFSVFQQGTFTPDSTFRWMPSIAMDKVGDIAVGYSVSSTAIFPGIRAAVRAPTDAAGTLGNEFVIKNGGGSQLTGLNRWGDYSAMTVDPVDDCTLWFTSEYLKANGTFNWSTQIASFKLAGCQ